MTTPTEDDFLADLEAVKAEAPEFIDVPFQLRGHLHRARFYALAGNSWSDLADRHPMRPGVLIDQKYGYNLRGLALESAQHAGRILNADGSERKLKPEQWTDLFKTVDGHTSQSFGDAIWGLNEFHPSQKLEALKKAQAAAFVRPSASPSN